MTTIERTQVEQWIAGLQQGLQDLLGDDLQQCAMIGIHSGGVWLGKILHRELGLSIPFGQLNISFYRDDFSHIGLHPVVGASEIPFNVDGQKIILVDDVIGTGRTIRAAMNEIFDYGRPSRIVLAALVDRQGRELPIRADVLGHSLQLDKQQHIKLITKDLTFKILEDNKTDS